MVQVFFGRKTGQAPLGAAKKIQEPNPDTVAARRPWEHPTAAGQALVGARELPSWGYISAPFFFSLHRGFSLFKVDQWFATQHPSAETYGIKHVADGAGEARRAPSLLGAPDLLGHAPVRRRPFFALPLRFLNRFLVVFLSGEISPHGLWALPQRLFIARRSLSFGPYAVGLAI